MSDPQEPVGEPVEEPESVDDVVGRAHEGLAEAEAAGRSATEPAEQAEPAESAGPAEPASDAAPAEPAAADEPVAADEPAASDEPVFATPALNDAYIADPEPADEPAAEPEKAPEPATEIVAEPAADTIAQPEPAAEPSPATEPAAATEPYAATAAGGAAAASVAGESAAPQPIFVQAPEEPRPRGNRGAAGGIGLLAAICFAVLYLAAGLVIGLTTGDVSADGVGTWLVDALATWGLWVPTIVFFVAFWLLGAIINRSRWGAWVIFGLLVGVAAWAGHLLGQLFEAPFWMVTASEGADIVSEQLFAPLAIAAFVIGRELTIWFGAWVAARGKRMTALNVEARREYERTLEAGPQLSR